MAALRRRVVWRLLKKYSKVILLTSGVWFFLSLFQFQFYTSDSARRRSADDDFVISSSVKLDLDYSVKDGPGSNGTAVEIPSELKLKADEIFTIHQFNLMASDMIGVNRSLPDYRMPECVAKEYPVELPDTTIIIVFHNEAWSTLLRTIISAIERSPRHLLKEFVLVDDASTFDYLKDKLEETVRYLPVPVIVERMPERSGLVKARLHGAAIAQGQVLTFLDSHVECTTGWLEPLLNEVKLNRRVAACPIVDVIDDEKFSYSYGDDVHQGTFTWKLEFDWGDLPKREQERRGGDNSAPMRSPTMPGGLYSIDREYFYEIGAYDPDYVVWGGENIEMSFRLWQCGGEILFLPCSHVGHVFRKVSPYEWPGGVTYVLDHNNLRTAMVWMDEYKQFFLRNSPEVMETDHGDITQRLRLRMALGCKSFRWYLENVFPEAPIPVRFNSLGFVKNLGSGLCMDIVEPEKTDIDINLFDCHFQGGNQLFTLSASKQLINDGNCLEGEGGAVKLQKCDTPDEITDSQRWLYSVETKQLINMESKNCLEGPEGDEIVILQPCNDEPSQKWELEDFKELD